MITVAGRVAIPKYIENLIKEHIKLCRSIPDAFYIIPHYHHCELSVDNALEKLQKFAEKHYSEIEIVKNEFNSGIDRRKVYTDRAEKGTKLLRDRKVTIRVFGALGQIMDNVLKGKYYLTVDDYKNNYIPYQKDI